MSNECYNIGSRRYLGNKAKLVDWIMSIIDMNTINAHSFCDLFAGTGAVSERALQKYDKVIVNDFLYSNNVIYKAFWENHEWDKDKLERLSKKYDSIDANNISENYFSINYGNRYFEHSLAKIIGYIREDLENWKTDLNEKEYCIMLTSLIYSIDRLANTLGHFEAYIKKPILHRDFHFNLIKAQTYDNVKIYRKDANDLARNVHCDIAYLDPPYNSRQYSRFYHVYENLVKWDKPKLYGVAMKPKPENMSSYCHSNALEAFSDLITHIDTKYIVVSYNNTYSPKSKTSKNKISLDDIFRVLSTRGDTKFFTHDYNAFQAGKTELSNHKEYLFVTIVNKKAKA